MLNATRVFTEIRACGYRGTIKIVLNYLHPFRGYRDPQQTSKPPAARRVTATMMCGLRGDQLQDWMAAVDADDLPALRSVVRGLRRDYDAVTAALTLTHNSGAVEGHVNRLKKIKRQMFGRAKPDLLRKRVLLGDCPSAPEPITETVPDPRLERR